MEPTPDDEKASAIEASLSLPAEVVDPALEKIEVADAARGGWTSPREARMPDPPWPAHDDPMLWFLIEKANASLDAGMDPSIALRQLAVHAWFEGGIDGYDRGQADARRPRAI